MSGRKCELVGGVLFAASENDVKLIKTAEQVDEQLLSGAKYKCPLINFWKFWSGLRDIMSHDI